MTNEEIRDFLQQAIGENRVMLFMKGTPEAPACGFSARTAAALDALGTPYAALDVLPDPRIRQQLSAISNWPTCDIVTEMYETGELAELLGVEPPPADEAPAAPEPAAPQSGPIGLENRLG